MKRIDEMELAEVGFSKAASSRAAPIDSTSSGARVPEVPG